MQGGVPWRDMDRATLDRAYNNAAAVADSAAVLAGWDARSARLRGDADAMLDLRYGPRPRNRIDIFKAGAGAGAPTLAFIHGGYWQMRAKEAFAFVAEGPLARGINVALIGYTLAPEATMDDMVAEIREALDWLDANLCGLGGDPKRLWLAGWSAGAQLAAMMLDRPALRGCVAISGIYDLEPMRHCFVNDKLGLDADAAARNSPVLRRNTVPIPLSLYVGGDELPLMRSQTHDYAAALGRHGRPPRHAEVPGRDHFTILDELSDPDGAVTRDIASQMDRPKDL